MKRLKYSLYFPALIIIVLWAIKFAEWSFDFSLVRWGIYPRQGHGLIGIFTAPLIHADFKHLYNNTIPLFVVSWILIYFYKEISYRVFFLTWLITGFWVWAWAREAYHIGASGVVYGLIAFVFFSGILRKDIGLMTISLLMVFLYGSMIWGIFPFLADVSWESHLSGGLAGLILSIYFRGKGPQRKKYEWEYEQDDNQINNTDINN